MLIEVIILSRCESEADFLINCQCISSLNESESGITFSIKLIESNKQFYQQGFSYPFPNVQVITPTENFNYNKFLNIGLKNTKSQFVAFCNNDLVFHKGWMSSMLEVKKMRPEIKSFCPFDKKSKYLNIKNFNGSYLIGYRTAIEFVGWCFVVERSVLEKTRGFDETFDLYFQDTDFALTMKKNGIVHALVPASNVEHIGGYTTKSPDATTTNKYQEGRLKFHKKWGSQNSLQLKHKIYTVLSILKLNYLGKFLYH